MSYEHRIYIPHETLNTFLVNIFTRLAIFPSWHITEKVIFCESVTVVDYFKETSDTRSWAQNIGRVCYFKTFHTLFQNGHFDFRGIVKYLKIVRKLHYFNIFSSCIGLPLVTKRQPINGLHCITDGECYLVILFTIVYKATRPIHTGFIFSFTSVVHLNRRVFI